MKVHASGACQGRRLERLLPPPKTVEGQTGLGAGWFALTGPVFQRFQAIRVAGPRLTPLLPVGEPGQHPF